MSSQKNDQDDRERAGWRQTAQCRPTRQQWLPYQQAATEAEAQATGVRLGQREPA